MLDVKACRGKTIRALLRRGAHANQTHQRGKDELFHGARTSTLGYVAQLDAQSLPNTTQFPT